MRAVLILVLSAVATGAACSSETSYAVVSVLTDEGSIEGVTQLRVEARLGDKRETLFFPKEPGESLRIDRETPLTFSLSFSENRTGILEVHVTALSVGQTSLGYGVGRQHRKAEPTTRVTVLLSPGAMPPKLPPSGAVDGGTSDARPIGTVQSCEPTAAASCGSGNTCFVGCAENAGAGVCTKGGLRRAGEACAGNADCEPGTQCFGFSCGMQAPKVCMKFCKQDGDCGAGARCFTGVPCGSTPTSHRACSMACDPRADGRRGCAAGLVCLIFPGEVPDCDCPGGTRISDDGMACGDARDCAPGLLCVSQAGGRVCRPICRLDAPDCGMGRSCTKLQEPDYKIWGACLP